jgi:putative flippase GtrA
VGIFNTCFSVFLFYILLQSLKNIQYQLILFIAFVIANLQSHFTQRVFVWDSNNLYVPELLRFFVGAIGVFALNLVLLTLMVEYLGYTPFGSQVLITLSLTIFNYFLQKHTVFRANSL